MEDGLTRRQRDVERERERERKQRVRRGRGVEDKVWKATEEGGSRVCGGVGQLSSSYPHQNLAAVQKYTQECVSVCLRQNESLKSCLRYSDFSDFQF